MQQLNNIKYIVGNNGTISIFAKSKQFTVRNDHPKYQEVLEALRQQDSESVINLVNISTQIRDYTSGSKVEVKNGQVYFMGEVLHNGLTERILNLMKLNLPFDGMVKFLENLMMNPSFRARQELYQFLENRCLPITEDGCFLAYKCVRSNYLDKHSGKFNNKPGAVMEMDRAQVDDDCRNTCSYGFHVGSLGYSGPNGDFYSLGDQVIVVKVNPRDAVSVPADYNAQKLRVCRYEVLRDYDKELDGELYKADGTSWNSNGGCCGKNEGCSSQSDKVDDDDDDDDYEDHDDYGDDDDWDDETDEDEDEEEDDDHDDYNENW